MQLCRVCGQWVSGNDKQWQKHLLSDRHQAHLHKITSQERQQACGVFITSFNPNTITLDILKSLFKCFGKIVNGFLANNKRFATLEFDSRKAALKALSNGVYFENQRLVVKPRIRRQFQRMGPPPPLISMSPLPVSRHVTVRPDGNWEQQTRDLMCALGVPLQPRADGEDLRISHVQWDIQRALAQTFGSCVTHIFGSRKTGMARLDSDVDIFVDLSNSEYMQNLSSEELEEKNSHPKIFHENIFKLCVRSMRKCGLFQSVNGVARARTPVIKFLHVNTGIQGDVSFKNFHGIWNSELIKYYIDLDVRVRFLVVIIRHWLLSLSSAFISSYTMSMMLFSYLQSLPDPVLPSFQHLLSVDEQNIYSDGWHCSFVPIAFSTSNKQNIQELLQGFFTYLATFDFGVDVLCCKNGTAVPKWRFLHTEFIPEDQSALKEAMLRDESHALPVRSLVCMQDVLELDHCTTKGMTQKHLLELRQRCSAAADYCVSDSHILQGLFSLQPKPLHPSNIIVIDFTNFFPPLEDLKAGVDIKLCWLEKVVCILGQVFDLLFHLKFVEEPAVSDIQINGEFQMWSLVSNYCLWENRQKARLSKKVAATLTLFQREMTFSKMLIKKLVNSKKIESETKVNVYIKFTTPPTQIQLEIETKSNGGELLRFLQLKLQAIVEKGLVEDYSKVSIPDEDTVMQQFLGENSTQEAADEKTNSTNMKCETSSSHDVMEVCCVEQVKSVVPALENSVLSPDEAETVTESNILEVDGAAKLLAGLGSSVITASNQTLNDIEDMEVSETAEVAKEVTALASESDQAVNESNLLDVSIAAQVEENNVLSGDGKTKENKRKTYLSESSATTSFPLPPGYVLVKSYVYDPKTKKGTEIMLDNDSDVSTSSFEVQKPSNSENQACKKSKRDM